VDPIGISLHAVEDLVGGRLVGRDAKIIDLLYRVNPSGAAALIARQMKSLIGG
jgi:hypothetical protein